MPVKDLPCPGMARVEVRADVPVLAVCSLKGNYFAADDSCTHAEAPLSEGDLDGSRVTCYLHQAVFDLAQDGAVVTTGGPGTVRLRVFPTRVEGGFLFADVPEGPAPQPGILQG